MNKIKEKISTNKGFVRIIIALIIILVVLSLLGLNVNRIWYGLILPIFSFIGNLIYMIAGWLVGLLRNAWEVVSGK